MLKSLFRKFSRFADREERYITILYVEKDLGVVVHDSLTCNTATPIIEHRPVRPVQEFTSELLFDQSPIFLMNPANGLFMLDDYTDVCGNPLGFDSD